MDPDTALSELRQMVATARRVDAESIDAPADYDSNDEEIDDLRADLDAALSAQMAFAERFDALDQWIVRGGFLPSAWPVVGACVPRAIVKYERGGWAGWRVLTFSGGEVKRCTMREIDARVAAGEWAFAPDVKLAPFRPVS